MDWEGYATACGMDIPTVSDALGTSIGAVALVSGIFASCMFAILSWGSFQPGPITSSSNSNPKPR
jgi:hypothetical protein